MQINFDNFLIDKNIKTPPLLFVVGATASGKSALGMSVAKKIQTEILSCDSMQVYKDLNIGTAKPTEIEQKQVRHRLIDIISPLENFSVGDFVNLAKNEIALNDEKGVPSLFVGGTGLYVNSLVFDYALGNVEPDLKLREQLNDELNVNGVHFMHQKLMQLDRIAGEQIHPNNAKRVVRAIEICLSSGTKKSDNLQKGKNLKYNYIAFALNEERNKTYENIDKRVDIMRENGLETEIKNILQKFSLTPQQALTKQSFSAIGYREIITSLNGECSIDEAYNNIKLNTRHYAKRQLTWFKKLPNLVWLDKDIGTAELTEIVTQNYFNLSKKLL